VTLAQKVRSEALGRAMFRGCSISVDTCDGVVHLRGELPSTELAELLEHAVAQVPGVRKVESFLHLPGQVPPNKEAALHTVH
jgi:osmotically-inducible protein OsmY